MLATYSKPTTSPAILAMGAPLYGLPENSIFSAGSKNLKRDTISLEDGMTHYHPEVGSNPTRATSVEGPQGTVAIDNIPTPIKAGEGFHDRRPVVETAEGRTIGKPMGTFAINPGTRPDQFSRQAL